MHFNNEKEVEYFYWENLNKIARKLHTNGTITAKNKTDGLLEAGDISVLCEIKYDLDFTNNKSHVARVIIQALYYLKNFQKKGIKLPSSIFIGDDNEYFILSVKQFSEFLEDSYMNEDDPDWSIAPSSAYKKNPKLFETLFLKEYPRMMRYLDNDFDEKFITSRFTALAQNENIKTKLDNETIKKPFYYFTQTVLLNAENLKDHIKIKLFFSAITGNEDLVYTKGKIRFESKDYPVSDSYYAGFVNVYQTKYKTSEREKFIGSMDSLIKEEARRFHGAYFTPKIIVDYAHETIVKNLGENWKDEYVVWDPAAGTLNLTRDYNFKELYCSTLFQAELDLASDFNMEATKFQFDFLNDEFKPERNGGKVPDGLYDAINDPDKKVMILMNPPYGNTGSGHASNFSITGKNKTGVVNISSKMKTMKFHIAAREMYTNFIFNVLELTKNKKEDSFIMGLFSNSSHYRNKGFSNFRKYFVNRMNLKDNFAFDSKYFEGAAGGWPILFSFLENKKTINEDQELKFIEIKDNKVSILQNHLIYTPKEPLRNWIKDAVIINKDRKLVDLCVSMPTTLKLLRKHKLLDNFIGDLAYSSNVEGSTGHNGLFSAAYSHKETHIGLSIENFYEGICGFSVLSLVEKTIFNTKDEFLKPDTTNTKFENYKNDALILSLFHKNSKQSSLRKVGYDSKGEPINYPTSNRKGTINVYNEWFWLKPNGLLKDLADENFPEMYQDMKGHKKPYVYNEIKRIREENVSAIFEMAKNHKEEVDASKELYKLFTGEEIEIESSLLDEINEYNNKHFFSKEALDVLDAGRQLVLKLMQPIEGKPNYCLRRELHIQFPEYHLNAWDAGYWQLRTALKKAGMESYLDDLNKKYKLLEDKMRPLVYKLGFLKNN